MNILGEIEREPREGVQSDSFSGIPHGSLPRHLYALALLLFGVAALSDCKPKGDATVIGSFMSLSGPDSTFGTDSRDGIVLAVEEANAKGGVRGKQVRLILEDNKSTAYEASNKVRQLIDRDHVVAIIGEAASSRSIAGGLVANLKKVPLIAPSATSSEVTTGREYVFRSCFTDVQQGTAAAEYIWGDQKRKRVAIFYVAQDSYSYGLARVFKDTYLKKGGEIALEKGYQKGETNFTTYLKEIRDRQPDGIFVPNYYNDMVQIGRQATQLGMPGSLFMGGDGWGSPNLLAGAGPELEGAHFIDHFAPDIPWPNSQAFLRAYRSRFGHAPNGLSAPAYDATRLLFDAMERAASYSGDDLRDAIAATHDFVGATGTITIDSHHNAIKPAVVVEVRNSAFHYTTQVDVR